jgi:hypothetical protein
MEQASHLRKQERSAEVRVDREEKLNMVGVDYLRTSDETTWKEIHTYELAKKEVRRLRPLRRVNPASRKRTDDRNRTE